MAAFDEVRARTDQLDKESLQRLLIGLLGDPVWMKVEKEAASILKSSSKALLAAPSHALAPWCECLYSRRTSQCTYHASHGSFRGGKS